MCTTVTFSEKRPGFSPASPQQDGLRVTLQTQDDELEELQGSCKENTRSPAQIHPVPVGAALGGVVGGALGAVAGPVGATAGAAAGAATGTSVSQLLVAGGLIPSEDVNIRAGKTPYEPGQAPLLSTQQEQLQANAGTNAEDPSNSQVNGL